MVVMHEKHKKAKSPSPVYGGGVGGKSRSDFIPVYIAESQTAWVDTHPTVSRFV